VHVKTWKLHFILIPDSLHCCFSSFFLYSLDAFLNILIKGNLKRGLL